MEHLGSVCDITQVRLCQLVDVANRYYLLKLRALLLPRPPFPFVYVHF